jgi:hypothetical protein
MEKLPLPSIALIAFDEAKRKAAARSAERHRQLFLQPVDLRYCPGFVDPRLLRTAETED